MNDQTKKLAARLLEMADDELILAHRNSEWIGHAPILEEDIAIANIAQDELGHATIWYDLYTTLTSADAEELVFQRDAANWRNVQLVELPRGDWAFTMLRQFLFDAYELHLLRHLSENDYAPLAEAVAKMQNEELYHYRHSSTWVRYLGLGTDESKQRMQAALDELWGYAAQLFVGEHAPLYDQWREMVSDHLTACGLIIPTDDSAPTMSRSMHTLHLTNLLADMQIVARREPAATW